MYLYLKGLSSNNLSIEGDDGEPNVSIVGATTETVDVSKVQGNVLFCTSCASMITSAKLEVRIGTATGRILTAAEMTAVQNGTLFDMDQDGIVDESEGVIRVKFSAVDLKVAATDYTAVLPGDGTKRFHPQRYFFLCKTATALSADGTVNLGIASGGTTMLAAQALTGLNLVNEVFRADVAVTAAATVADNATLYLEMAAADTGTSGTMDVYVEGVFL